MKNVIISCAVLFCSAAAPMFAAGGITTCTAKMPDGVLIQNNLHVPAGASCQLNWAEVMGNVTVEGTLISFSSQYDKNIDVTGAGAISIANGYSARPIKGNLKISGSGQSGIYPANDGNNVVLGNIIVTGLNNGGSFSISQATVGGVVEVNYNSGRVDLSYMTIGKNLDCSNNEPAPTSWSLYSDYGPHQSSNTATQKTGQCAGL
jgi:hypothetical protein